MGPSTKSKHAFNCYVKRFGESKYHTNIDICLWLIRDYSDHNLLVGGFPCQDYSVARSLSNEKGIQGKRVFLWWQIYETLEVKRPAFVLLENVDRLIKSPSKQRGRDFGIMLRCLNDLGYSVEWRVINAGEYGFPQRRRRVYIFAYHKNTDYYNKMMSYTPYLIFNERGLFANTFSSLINEVNIKITNIGNDKYPSVLDISEKFQFRFENAGLAINNKYTLHHIGMKSDYSCSLSSKS